MRNKQTDKGGMTELRSFEDGDNFSLMQTSVHVLWIEILKHLPSMYVFMLANFFVLTSFLGAHSRTGVHEHSVELLFVCCRCLHLQNAGACLNVCSCKQICNVFPLVSVEVCQIYHLNFFMSHPPHLWSRIIKLTYLKKGVR